MRLQVATDDGSEIEFECADTPRSSRIVTDTLAGRVHLFVPFLDDVGTIVDVGADVGATTVHLARHFPDALVHSFEPAPGARALLERNVAPYDNVRVHPSAAVGQWASDEGIARIDVLALAIDAGAVAIMTGLTPLLPTVQVLYVEYHSRQARREVAGLVDATHDLYLGVAFMDQGNVTYLRRDLADHPDANPVLLAHFNQAVRDRSSP